MAALRKSREMQNQILTLRAKGESIRAIARALKIHRDTVRANLPTGDVHKTDDGQKPPDPGDPCGESVWYNSVDWEHVRKEHGRGIALKVLWQEVSPEVDYLRFWRGFRRLCPVLPEPVLRLQHNPGERCQIDYTDGIEIVDLKTGQKIQTQLFVGVLPFSSLTFGEFVIDQKLPTFIGSQQSMFTFFGGVTQYTVIDNLKSGVTKAHLYDPDTNRTYCEFGNHMGFAVLPARPYTPHDKAAVEGAIGIIQETFFARVRNRVFTSLFDLNQALKAYLVELNSSVMKDYGVSRLDRFAEEKKYLKPLPPCTFVFSEWKSAKVHPDCHIQVGKNYYSVPHTFVGLVVRVRLSAKLVEVFGDDAEPLAVHAKITGEHRYATDNRHYPEAKFATASFNIHQAQAQAKRIGPETEKLIEHLFAGSHPLKYLRRVQGILRLAEKKRVSIAALEYACKIALVHKNTRFPNIEAIARYHDKCGPRPVSLQTSLPRREEQTLFLHGQQTKENP